MTLPSESPATSKKQAPASQRRCRVALLPDSHVRYGWDERPRQPARRLYGAARHLLETTVQRLPSLEVDAALLLGDTLDPADEPGLAWLSNLMAESPVPLHIVIGNHEYYGGISVAQFHAALGLPEHGCYVAEVKGVPFLMLGTPDQDSLSPGSVEYQWFAETLSGYDSGTDLFCCAHFSLLLHPCVRGPKNDGMQVLWPAEAIKSLLRRHPNVRAWIGGHKNVPSKVIEDGRLHLLSPQLIQAPCAFSVLDICVDGIASRVYDVQEQYLARLSRQAYGQDYAERHGTEDNRNFWWSWRTEK